MNPSRLITCTAFPCSNAVHESYALPDLELNPARIKLIMIAECAPISLKDYFYSKGEPLFVKTTLQAFRDADEDVHDVHDILQLGVYLTTAVKCGKSGYAISKETIKTCSQLLEQELALFPKTEVILLMGDVAISAINAIARRKGLPRPIPAGSTYKIRGGKYDLNGIRLFPSYLQAGASFFIEKGKRRMIAEDIASGLKVFRRVRKASSGFGM